MTISRKLGQAISIESSSEQVIVLIPIPWNEIIKELFLRPIDRMAAQIAKKEKTR
ncbi:hypothetical protein [Scytonema sp. PCC 10023]|uniref:hypothetical protein n=1 Tax=Scytonema sp. PCC 10023 TaxID=1680591 RepID=UPI0039C681E0